MTIKQLRYYAKLASSADLRTLEEEQPLSGNVQPRKKEDCRYLESYGSAVGRPSNHSSIDALADWDPISVFRRVFSPSIADDVKPWNLDTGLGGGGLGGWRAFDKTSMSVRGWVYGEWLMEFGGRGGGKAFLWRGRVRGDGSWRGVVQGVPGFCRRL